MAWDFSTELGFPPYFDQPFYVGFSVAGYELALDPNASVTDGAVTYWGVRDCDAGLAWLLAGGATERTAVTDVGDGIRVATVEDSSGGVVGIIENPHFELPTDPGPTGPGR